MNLSMPEKKRPSLRLLWLAAGLVPLLALGGYLYWHYSGRMTLEGRLQGNAVFLVSERGGSVLAVMASPGQRVHRGEVLLRFDDAPLRRILAAEQQELSRLQQLIPPDMLRVPANGRPDGRSDESMTERLERQRGIEAEAERRVQQATDNEAQASILHSRAVMLAAQKKISPQERDAAEAALQLARQETQAARDYFTSVSLARAATGADIQRLRAVQAAAGASQTPVDARIAAYHAQAQRTVAAEADLNSTVVLAPDNGVILDVLAKAGAELDLAAPCFLFRADSSPPMVRALADDAQVGRLGVGQQSRVVFDNARDAPIAGYVSALLPEVPVGAASLGRARTSVWVTLEAEPSTSLVYTLPDFSKATITVLLREPLLAASSLDPDKGSGAASLVLPQAPGAPSALPVAVQSPFGEDPAAVRERQAGMPTPHTPPVLKAGSPEAAGKAPTLPPMQAPEQLTGSPLPDPHNNPSLVTPNILENAATAPR